MARRRAGGASRWWRRLTGRTLSLSSWWLRTCSARLRCSAWASSWSISSPCSGRCLPRWCARPSCASCTRRSSTCCPRTCCRAGSMLCMHQQAVAMWSRSCRTALRRRHTGRHCSSCRGVSARATQQVCLTGRTCHRRMSSHREQAARSPAHLPQSLGARLARCSPHPVPCTSSPWRHSMAEQLQASLLRRRRRQWSTCPCPRSWRRWCRCTTSSTPSWRSW
mmetsp:Transcript_474/g.1264  ORF Transcript_474/g.1264 Transcript_474/m.1264 type:complete len:222 (+) Transcript_474:759-1424(+)